MKKMDEETKRKRRLLLSGLSVIILFLFFLGLNILLDEHFLDNVGSGPPLSTLFLIFIVMGFNIYQNGWGKRVKNGCSHYEIKGYCLKITMRITLIYFILFFAGLKIPFLKLIMWWPNK